jgi:DNA-binding MarR family transcriptional regulator
MKNNGNGKAVDPVERELAQLAEPLRKMLSDEEARQMALMEQLHASRDRTRRILKTLSTLTPEASAKKRAPKDTKKHKWVPSEQYKAAVIDALRKHGELNSTDLRDKLSWNSGTVSQVVSYLRDEEVVRLAGMVKHPKTGREVKVYALMEA